MRNIGTLRDHNNERAASILPEPDHVQSEHGRMDAAYRNSTQGSLVRFAHLAGIVTARRLALVLGDAEYEHAAPEFANAAMSLTTSDCASSFSLGRSLFQSIVSPSSRPIAMASSSISESIGPGCRPRAWCREVMVTPER